MFTSLFLELSNFQFLRIGAHLLDTAKTFASSLTFSSCARSGKKYSNTERKKEIETDREEEEALCGVRSKKPETLPFSELL